jgi:hypothetical protein
MAAFCVFLASGLSAIIAILIASLVGVMFSTLFTARAAQLDPFRVCGTE